MAIRKTTLRLLLAVMLELIAVPFVLSDYNHTIYVDPEKGNDSTACLDSPSPSQPCRSLSYAFQPQYRASSTQYVLQPGTHYLNSTASDVPFTDLQDIAITGNDSDSIVRVVCFTPNAGLAFINVGYPRITNVIFSNCAATQNSTSQNCSDSGEFRLSLTKMALYFNNCDNVFMENVHVVDSPGASGVTIYNTIGVNNFTRCNFSNNRRSSDPYAYPGGGGVYIEFSYCLPGDNGCANGTKDSYTENNKDSTYLFTECTFAHNKAFIGPTNASFMVTYHQNHMAFGRGGGLSVFFNGNSSNNTFNISNCTFLNNTAMWGAGMFVEYRDSSGGNTVSISGSTFQQNECRNVSGGGLRLSHYVYGEEVAAAKEGNRVEIHNSTFSENHADNGGGLSISPARQHGNSSRLFSVLVNGTTFKQNRASYGAAVKVELYTQVVEGRKPNVTLLNCLFSNNSVYPPIYPGPHEVGVGAVYINQVNVHFRGTMNFVSNNGSALALVATLTDFMNCSVYFSNNTGITGGAIALLGTSKLIINESSVLKFISNSANEGGAIYNKYVNRNNYQESSNCFIAHVNPFLHPDQWRANFTFNFNSDFTGHNAIYSTSILPCVIAGDSGEERSIERVLCWRNWAYDNIQSENCSKFIRTGPGKITSDRMTLVSPPNTTVTNHSIIIPAYPGIDVPLSITAEDDLHHPLSVVYTATPMCNNYTDASCRKELKQIVSTHSYIAQDRIRVFGPGDSGNNVIVNLDAVGDRIWHVKVTIELHKCPPGLLPTNVSCDSSSEPKDCIACECIQDLANYNKFVRCNSLRNASLTSGYWMGYLSREVCSEEKCVVVAPCPPGFCITDAAEFIVLPKSRLDEHICAPQKRKGILCGDCIEGYGPALNSDTYECVPCNITRSQLAAHATYYVLAVYLPLFALSLAVIVFNMYISLTTGPANAFILYSQVISSTFDLDANRKIPFGSVIHNVDGYLNAYKFPYGIFNLEFFEIFVPNKFLCLGTGLNTLDILMLEYIVAFFPLAMIIVVILLFKLNRCCCCSRRVRRNLQQFGYSEKVKECQTRLGDALIPSFAIFVLLSYTKFSLTSSYLSLSQDFYDASGNKKGHSHAYHAGQFSVNDRTYILFYYLPAILIFLTFVAIPPLVLLDYPMRLFEKALRKVPWLWRRYPQIKIHIVLDAFQGCYKNKWRCFAGLYFVFRLLINLTYIFADSMLQFSLQGMYCTFFSLLVAYLKPYKREFHLFNYVDSIIFLNLAIINQISFYLYAYTRNGSTPPISAFAVQYVLVFLPLIYMVSYIVWSVLPIPNIRARVKEWLANRQSYQQLDNLIRNSGTSTPEPTDDGNVNWERAREVNSYSPTTHMTANSNSHTGKGGRKTDSGLASVGGIGSKQSYGSTGDSSTVSFDTAIPGEDD